MLLTCISVMAPVRGLAAVEQSARPQIRVGSEPWIIMFKKGVDGQQLWDKLCPSISIGDVPLEDLGSSLVGTDTFSSPNTGKQLLLNCTAHFNSLLNGFAGKQTLMRQ